MVEKKTVRKRIGFILRVLVGAGLLTFVLWWVGPRNVWESVRHADIPVAFIFFPLCGLVGLIGAARWRMLLACQEIHISLWQAAKLTLLGFFFNNFLPGLTGDVVKAVYVSGHTEHKTRAALSVLVDRLVGMVSLGIVALIALLVVGDKEMIQRGTYIVIALLVMCVGVSLAFIGGRAWGMDRLAKRFPLWGVSEELVKASDCYMSSKKTLLGAGLLSVAAQAAMIVMYYGYGRALGIEEMRFTDYVFFVPMVGFIGALPISIMMGLGTGEWTTAWFLDVKGVGKDIAVALSLMVRVTVVVWSLPGGLVALFYRREKRREEGMT